MPPEFAKLMVKVGNTDMEFIQKNKQNDLFIKKTGFLHLM